MEKVEHLINTHWGRARWSRLTKHSARSHGSQILHKLWSQFSRVIVIWDFGSTQQWQLGGSKQTPWNWGLKWLWLGNFLFLRKLFWVLIMLIKGLILVFTLTDILQTIHWWDPKCRDSFSLVAGEEISNHQPTSGTWNLWDKTPESKAIYSFCGFHLGRLLKSLPHWGLSRLMSSLLSTRAVRQHLLGPIL